MFTQAELRRLFYMMNEVKAYHCDKCDGYYLKEEHYCRGDRKCEDCGVALDI